MNDSGLAQEVDRFAEIVLEGNFSIMALSTGMEKHAPGECHGGWQKLE